MKQTSLLAYQGVKSTLTQRQYAVMRAIRECGGRATMHKVALRLFLPLHSVSGRFSELEKKGWIKAVDIDTSPQRRPRTVYAIKEFPIDLSIPRQSDIAINHLRSEGGRAAIAPRKRERMIGPDSGQARGAHTPQSRRCQSGGQSREEGPPPPSGSSHEVKG